MDNSDIVERTVKVVRYLIDKATADFLIADRTLPIALSTCTVQETDILITKSSHTEYETSVNVTCLVFYARRKRIKFTLTKQVSTTITWYCESNFSIVRF